MTKQEEQAKVFAMADRLVDDLTACGISQPTALSLVNQRLETIFKSGLDWRFWVEEFGVMSALLLEDARAVASIVQSGPDRTGGLAQ